MKLARWFLELLSSLRSILAFIFRKWFATSSKTKLDSGGLLAAGASRLEAIMESLA